VATSAQVRSWGKHAHGSPLYAHLVEVIAADEELMAVLNRIEHLPQVNLLLGAVHYLLLTGGAGELSAYYRSLNPDPLAPDRVDGSFRDFVLEHRERIVEIGNSRYTQTNECRRCVVLLPLVMTAPFERFHLIEIGASAGLNLALDLYSYQWGDRSWGPKSTVTLTGEHRGADFPLHEIEVLSRIGLDLDPIDPGDTESRLWLDALIWPEQAERRHRLRAALDLVAGISLEMVAGDALETLPGALSGLPSGEPAVVMDAFSLNQLSVPGRDQVERIAEDARSEREVFRVSMELLDADDEWAKLAVADGPELRMVGQAHSHGEWLELWPDG
jgi:hypothetical protein